MALATLGWEENRNLYVSYVSGIIYAIAWWVLIDGTVAGHFSQGGGTVYASMYVPGLLATVGLIIINMIPFDVVTGDSFYDGPARTSRMTALFGGFILLFGSLIASIWIFVAVFDQNSEVSNKYPGASILISNLFIFLCTFLYKFGRRSTDSI